MINSHLEKESDLYFSRLQSFSSIKHPIYIPSKGRAEIKMTAFALKSAGIKYYIVVEPQDYSTYLEYHDKDSLLVMPENDKGISYVRNFCKKHSISIGADYHWQVDDNIKDFRIRKNKKNIKSDPLNIFALVEYYTSKWDNIGISSLTHIAFAFAKTSYISLNIQCYSCVLINNTLDIWWKDNIIEDTDYSLQVLEAGYCSFVFNALLMNKEITMKLKGGNTEISHANGGRLKRLQNLQAEWPNYFKIIEKFGKPTMAPSRCWRKYEQLPKNKEIDLNPISLI